MKDECKGCLHDYKENGETNDTCKECNWHDESKSMINYETLLGF